MSDAPVTLVPEASQDFISFASTGSVTAEKITGIELVAAMTDCADGVAIATMASGLSAANCLAI